MSMEAMLDSYYANSALQATCQIVGNKILRNMALAYQDVGPKKDLKFARIAEFGCSGGSNSYEPMNSVISVLSNGSPGICAECILEDLPSNPWHQVMETAPRLSRELDNNVQVLCAGTSFYDRVCGEATVDLAYSYVSVHFISDAPPLTAHILMHESGADEKRAWEAQAAGDWEKFLALRARELKKGGKMLLSTMSRDDAGYSWKQSSHLMWECVKRAAARGLITKQEEETLCIPACLRSESEIMAPFAASGKIGSLFAVDSLEFARTEVEGERELPAHVLAPLIRKRVESVWGGMFLAQLRRLGRSDASARSAMNDVWDAFEGEILQDPMQGWLDMRCFYLQVTRK
jgi:hypothetical protein